MAAHDYRVEPLTVEQLESRTLFYRKKWGLDRAARIDVFRLLFEAMPSCLSETGLKMISRSAGFMGLRDAYATSKPRRIFYRDRLFAQLRLGDPHASIIFLHELAHVLLHPGAPKAWLTQGYTKVAYIEDERSAEWQASTFALCLKAPTHLAVDCHSAAALAQRFGLSSLHAAERYETIRLRRPRKIPNAPVASKMPKTFIECNQERCPDCGSFILASPYQKYSCDVCRRYGDKFQDGDQFGCDF